MMSAAEGGGCVTEAERGKEKLFAGSFFQKGKRKKAAAAGQIHKKKEAGARRWANENLPHFPFTPTPTREREEEKPLGLRWF